MYEINEKLANEVMRYLSTRPYAEVYQLIAQLSQLQKAKNKEKPEKQDGGEDK